MSQNHTPGPWRPYSSPERMGWSVEWVSEEFLNDGWHVVTEMPGPDAEANARLIAAAPDLLAACELAIPTGVCLTNKNVPDNFTVALDCTMGDLRKIAAAIAKAKASSS